MQIYEAISNVMSEIGHVGKDSKNNQQGWKFRGIDAVMNALYPALTKYKVFVAPEVLEQTREERTTAKGTILIYSICKIKFRFYTTDGSYVDVVTIGEGMDSGDKATNKAMSIALKYAFFQTFCIPTEDMMDDPDKEVHVVVDQHAELWEMFKKKYQNKDERNAEYKKYCEAYSVADLKGLSSEQYEAIKSKLV